jgi:hypothetical protein
MSLPARMKPPPFLPKIYPFFFHPPYRPKCANSQSYKLYAPSSDVYGNPLPMTPFPKFADTVASFKASGVSNESTSRAAETGQIRE